jgi:hypothetical protein
MDKIPESVNKETPEEVELNTFDDNLHKNLQSTISKLAAANPAEVVDTLKTFISIAGEVKNFTEDQKTKRKEIEAKRDFLVNKIQTQKEIILTYLDKSFDERKKQFEKHFKVIDDAIEKNNIQQLAMGLDSMNKLAASSPFKDLANIDNVKHALGDKTYEWDF